MVINFNQELHTIDGETLMVKPGQKSTLKIVACDALQAVFNDETHLEGSEKVKRWVLATRIWSNPEKIDLEVEEIALLKKLIGKAYGPLVVGQAWAMLEGEQVTKG